MSFGFVVVVAGLAAAGYYGYRKLIQIEEEIHARKVLPVRLPSLGASKVRNRRVDEREKHR